MKCKELYIVLNSPVQLAGDIAEVTILGECLSKGILGIEIRDHKGIIRETEIHIEPGRRTLYAFEFQTPRAPGRYELQLRSEGSLHDKIHYLVIDRDHLNNRYLTFVWHNHQAPNYLPNGSYFYPWAFTHTYNNELDPYGKGPYHYHSVILDKYREYRSTYNLSPSLLAQWKELVEKGVHLYDGTIIEPDSIQADIVKQTIKLYREAANRGQIDVLTSIYAHTIAGFVIEHLGAEDLILEEVEYGMNVTKEVIGVDPRGVWTPEMAFTMRLIDLYGDLNLEYTVLDAKCHLENSEGDIGGYLEPYSVRGSRHELIIFFRDTELSNIMSFNNNFRSQIHAMRSAYDFAYKIVHRLMNGGILVIALDGENWMIFSKNPSLTAVFYDKLIEYLTRIQSTGYLKTTTLRELVDIITPRRTLKRIPTTTWLCGFAKWNGEIREHPIYWDKVKKLYLLIKSYEQRHGSDERSRRARWALWHALDSDYWWAEFWAPELIDTWLCEIENSLGKAPATCRQIDQSSRST